MLKSSEIKTGQQLEIRDAMRPADSEAGLVRLTMSVGRAGDMNGRLVGLMRGDILVVEGKPRLVDGKLLCRVRRALSQSIGEVLWTELRSAAVPRLN